MFTNDRDHWNNRDWLAKYYRNHGAPQEAIEAQMRLLLSSPGRETVKTLIQIPEFQKLFFLKTLLLCGNVGLIYDCNGGDQSMDYGGSHLFLAKTRMCRKQWASQQTFRMVDVMNNVSMAVRLHHRTCSL